MAVYQTSLPSNFPTKPTPINVNSKSFPNDLVKADGSRSFYTMINMVDYSTLSSTSSLLSGTNVLFNSSATGIRRADKPVKTDPDLAQDFLNILRELITMLLGSEAPTFSGPLDLDRVFVHSSAEEGLLPKSSIGSCQPVSA